MRLPVYPWLFSLYPPLHLYSLNLNRVFDHQVPVSIAIGLLLVSAVFIVSRWLTDSVHKAAAISMVLALIFYSFGHIALELEERNLRDLLEWQPTVTVIVALVLVVVLGKSRISATLSSLAIPFTVIVGALLVLPTISIANYWFTTLTQPELARAFPPTPVPEQDIQPVLDSSENPDIYYILVDAYTSNRYLMDEFGYDNSPFTGALEKQGFTVAYDSKSNYPFTLVSLPSVLNMEYIDHNPYEETVDDQVYLRSLIANNSVAVTLLNKGYKYNYMLSGYLVPSLIATRHFDVTHHGAESYGPERVKDKLNAIELESVVDGKLYKASFYRLLSDTSALRLLNNHLEEYFEPKGHPLGWRDTRRFFTTLDQLEQIPDDPHATFTFAHILQTHAPVQLDRQGNKLKHPQASPTEADYFAELEFINEKLLATVEALITKSQTPPVIIMQGDHGSYLGRGYHNGRRVFFEILTAIALPGSDSTSIRQDLSPVNTFAAVFNHVFGSSYPIQDQKRFEIVDTKKPFEQTDVTADF